MKTLLIVAAVMLVLVFLLERGEALPYTAGCNRNISVTTQGFCCDLNHYCWGLVYLEPNKTCQSETDRVECCASCYGENPEYFRPGSPIEDAVILSMAQDPTAVATGGCVTGVKIKGMDQCCDKDSYCPEGVNRSPDSFCNDQEHRADCCASCYQINPNYFRQPKQTTCILED